MPIHLEENTASEGTEIKQSSNHPRPPSVRDADRQHLTTSQVTVQADNSGNTRRKNISPTPYRNMYTISELENLPEEKLKEIEITPYGKEGFSMADWVLLDYSDVVLHVFTPESREFFNIEKLWADANEVDISDILDIKKD